jgi:hypothetical protein
MPGRVYALFAVRDPGDPRDWSSGVNNSAGRAVELARAPRPVGLEDRGVRRRDPPRKAVRCTFLRRPARRPAANKVPRRRPERVVGDRARRQDSHHLAFHRALISPDLRSARRSPPIRPAHQARDRSRLRDRHAGHGIGSARDWSREVSVDVDEFGGAARTLEQLVKSPMR